MRTPCPHPALVLGAILLLAGGACAPLSGESAYASGRGNAIVIPGEQLWARGGRLLDGLKGRIFSLQVNRASGRCPQVVLRGQRTLVGNPDPEVYVDGTRMSDTCVLDDLRVHEVQRVEVFRGGLSGPAGYAPSPNGLILVFLKDRAE